MNARSTDGSPPATLWWIYLLVGVALAVAGAGAGQALFFVHELGNPSAAQACLLDRGIRVSDGFPVTGQAAAAAGYGVCARSFDLRQGEVMVAGAVALPLLAGLLMLVGGLAMRGRLRSAGVGASIGSTTAAARITARFGHWCDRAALVGRRRPVVMVARPGRIARQAYTTAVPGMRPIVVIPAGYAFVDEAALDLVIVHELAHVRARDLSWAAATWWTGWLTVTALAAVLAPVVTQPRTLAGQYGYALAVAVIVGLATLTLRASVLRRREWAADRYAVAMSGRADVLEAAAAGTPTPPRWRRWASVHPAPGTRASAATEPAERADRWQGGFAVAAATGAVAMFAYQALAGVVFDLVPLGRMDGLPQDAALGVAAVVWAAIMVPAWSRSTRPWPSVAGSGLGLLVGFLLWSPGSLVSTGLVAFGGNLTASVPWTAAIVLGASVWARWFATMVRGPWTRLAAVTGAACLLATGLSVGTVVLYSGKAYGAAVGRVLLIVAADAWWWQWSLVVVFSCAVVLLLGARSNLDWWGIGLAAATGCLAGIATARIRSPHTSGVDAAYLLLAERWWICGLAGAIATLAAFLLARVTPASAFIAGGLAAVLAGAGQFLWDATRDRAALTTHNLLFFLRTPAWLALVITVLSAPLMALVPRRPLRPGVRVSLMVPMLVAADLALAGGSLAPLTIAPGDYNRLDAAAAAGPSPSSPVAPVPTPVAGHVSRAGRAIDAATARSALDAVESALPVGWVAAPNDSTVSQALQPQSCVDLFDRDTAAESTKPRTADDKRSYNLPSTLLPPTGAQLTVGLTSYQSQTFGAEWNRTIANEAVQCPEWTNAAKGPDDGRLRLTAAADTPPDLPYAAVALTLTGRFQANGQPGVDSIAELYVNAGNNEVWATAQVIYLGSTTMPAERVTYVRNVALSAVTSVLATLSQ